MSFTQRKTVAFSKRSVVLGLAVFVLDFILLATAITGALYFSNLFLQAAFAIAGQGSSSPCCL